VINCFTFLITQWAARGILQTLTSQRVNRPTFVMGSQPHEEAAFTRSLTLPNAQGPKETDPLKKPS